MPLSHEPVKPDVAETYDRLPYPSKFFALTHPDHLCSISSLLGVNAADPMSCRVLELGCGNGSNLISHAYTLRDAEFVGLDISPGHIKAANEATERLGLTNISFRCMDVKDLTEADFGRFDYVVAHGLISWIPPDLRERIFEVFAELLEPNGIGYASYNTFPGSYIRMMVRDICRTHAADSSDPAEAVQKSILMLSMLAEHSGQGQLHNQIYTGELNRHFDRDLADIYHDDLADEYHPLHFREFAEVLSRHNLQFLSEAEYHTLAAGRFSQEVRDFVADMDDIVTREQYLDFFRGRAFRQSLFCRSGLSIDRSPEPSALDRFRIASSLHPDQPDPDLSPGKVVSFAGNLGTGIQIDHSLSKAAICILGESWASPVAVPELLDLGLERLEKVGINVEDRESEKDIARNVLLRVLQATDALHLHSVEFTAPRELSDGPVLSSLGRWQIDVSDTVTTLFAINVEVKEEIPKQMLRLADGSRSVEEIQAGVRSFIEAAGDSIEPDDKPDDVDEWVKDSLLEMARIGVFEG